MTQRENTLSSLRRKLSEVARVGIGAARDPLDLDSFLSLGVGQYLFSDPYLRSPPSPKSVETLTRLGCPAWPLVNRGVVNEVFALLKTRRKKGLASPRQAQLLRDLGHTKP